MPDFGGADHAVRRRRFRHVQRHDVALGQKVLKAAHRFAVAAAELVGVIVEDHPHAERFGEIRKLGADVAVADDAERLASHLVAVVCRFVPPAGMRRNGSRDDPPQKHDDLADHQFRHAAGIREGRVEHRHAEGARGVDVDLICSDVEAADSDQPVGGAEDLGVNLGAGADADQVDASDGFAKRLAAESLGKALDAGIASRSHHLHGAFVDALEQQDPDPVLRQ